MKDKTAKRIMDFTRTGYNTIAAEFAASRAGLWWPEMESFRRSVQDGDRLLDLGCGNGRAYRLFAGSAVDYEGIDASEGLIVQAKRNQADLLANFRVGSMLSLPYENQSFDAVWAIASLHHIPSENLRLQALREAFRVLKPGGRLMMTNWDLWQRPRLKWLVRSAALKSLGISDLDWTDVLLPWKRRNQPPVWRYYHGFTLKEIARLGRRAGFEIEINERFGERRRRGDVNLVTICRRPAVS